jgi:transposase InsO family protein
LEHLTLVISALRAANLKASPEKCEFAKESLIYLGHVVNKDGISPDPAKVRAINAMQAPRTVTEVRSFMGAVGYYGRFLPALAKEALPITKLLKGRTKFVWGDEQQWAFERIKLLLVSTPILRRPKFDQPFIVYTDWSKYAMGAILAQVDAEGQEYVCAYASKKTTPAEANYSAYEGEAFCVVWALRHFRWALWGVPFKLVTDHAALQWLHKSADLSSKLTRWLLKLQEYSYTVEYRRGPTHGNVDALSRVPFDDPPPPPANTIVDTPPDGTDMFWGLYTLDGCGPSDWCPMILMSDGHTDGARQQQPREPSPAPDDPAGAEPDSPDIYADVKCQVCGESDDEDIMVLCDKCDEGYHTTCLVPPLGGVPEEDWYCPRCSDDGDAGGARHDGDLPDDYYADRDIHLDQATLTWLIEGEYVYTMGANAQDRDRERRRINRRAANYYHQADEIWRMPTAKFPEPRRVPKPETRQALLREYHNMGHYGSNKVLSLLVKRYYWSGMAHDIRRYIARCAACLNKRAKFQHTPDLRPLPIVPRFHRVHVDLVGPLPRTQRGNKYIAVAIDAMTKWTMAGPIPDKTAATVAHFFKTQVIHQHGCMAELVCDQGSEFRGEFADLCAAHYIRIKHTSAYAPQSNGQVERVNQTISNSLRRMAGRDDWDLQLSTTVYGYNITVSASTGHSPFFLLYGRDPVLPDDLRMRTQRQQHAEPAAAATAPGAAGDPDAPTGAAAGQPPTAAALPPVPRLPDVPRDVATQRAAHPDPPMTSGSLTPQPRARTTPTHQRLPPAASLAPAPTTRGQSTPQRLFRGTERQRAAGPAGVQPSPQPAQPRAAGAAAAVAAAVAVAPDQLPSPGLAVVPVGQPPRPRAAAAARAGALPPAGAPSPAPPAAPAPAAAAAADVAVPGAGRPPRPPMRGPAGMRATSPQRAAFADAAAQVAATTAAATAAAADRLAVAQDRNRRSYNKRRGKSEPIPLNSYVMVRQRRKPGKLEAELEGPYMLVGYAAGGTVARVRDFRGNEWGEQVARLSQVSAPGHKHAAATAAAATDPTPAPEVPLLGAQPPEDAGLWDDFWEPSQGALAAPAPTPSRQEATETSGSRPPTWEQPPLSDGVFSQEPPTRTRGRKRDYRRLYDDISSEEERDEGA